MKEKHFQFKKLVRYIFRNYLVALGILLLVLITIVVTPKFLTYDNFVNIIRQFGPLSFVSLGMTFVILAGYLDLSLGGLLSLVAVVTASLAVKIGEVPAILIGILLGAALGFINGAIIQVVHAHRYSEALFITFGTGMAFSAVALLYTGGQTQRLNDSMTVISAIGNGGIGIISVSFMIFLVILVILDVFQEKTYLGQTIIMAGGNPEAARLAGLPTNLSTITIYVISGLLTAVGAIVLSSRVMAASPSIGKNYETNAIMAVIIGGTSLKGGTGSVLRTVLGVVLVTLMSNCLNLLGCSTYVKNVIQGIIMIIAIWLDNRNSMLEEVG